MSVRPLYDRVIIKRTINVEAPHQENSSPLSKASSEAFSKEKSTALSQEEPSLHESSKTESSEEASKETLAESSGTSSKGTTTQSSGTFSKGTTIQSSGTSSKGTATQPNTSHTELYKMHSGVLIPEFAQENLAQGEVIAVGKGKVCQNGTVHPPELKVGDKVLFDSDTGKLVMVEGEEVFVIKEKKIIAVLGTNNDTHPQPASKHGKFWSR